MKVRLISYTQPTEEFAAESGMENLSDLVCYCARVSNPSNQSNKKTNARLIKYLSEHKHWSVFEMVSVCLEITTTRDIARQMLRHRSCNFQEFSQRYADPTDHLSFVLREARLQDPKNRQNSISLDEDNSDLQAKWDFWQQRAIDTSREAYQWAIENGIAKEQARAVLPEGNTVSRMYMNATLRSWIHYVDLRSGNGTQQEHIDIARACGEAIVGIFPDINKYVQE